MGPAPTFVNDPVFKAALTPVVVQGGTLSVTLVTDTTGIPVFVAGGSISFNLLPGNINIGSVHLMDSDSTNEAHVDAANTVQPATKPVLFVQHIDDTGTPLRQQTQAEIDTNTANTALILLDIDGTLAQVQADTAAIRMSGTRIESAILTGNSTLSTIQTDVASVPVDQAAIRISGTRIEGLLNADAITQSAIRISGTRVETAVLAGNVILSSVQTNTANIPSDQAAIRISGTRIESDILAGNLTLSTIQTNTANIPSDEAAIRISGTRVEGLLNADAITQAAIRISGTRVEGVLNTIASYGTRVTLYDSTGNPIGSSQTLTSDYHLGVAVTQEVFLSAKNSSTANLTASGTFVGNGETTLGVSAIQVSLKTDQNCTIFVDQSPDGVNWDINDTFIYYAAKDGDSWSVNAVNSFYRVRATNLNTSGTATSFFRLQTVLTPVANPLPRTLTQQGNLQVAVNELLPTFIGNSVKSSPAGSLRTCETARLVGVSFYGSTPDTNFWTTTFSGSTAGSPVSNQQVTLQTGTSSNGTSRIQSVRSARFVAGATPNFFRSIVRCPATTGANTRRWGPFSLTDGFFFEMNSGVLSLVTRKASADSKIANGSFNGLWGTSYVLDTNVHIFEIYWTPETTWFFIDDVLLHRIIAQNSPLSGTLDLPVSEECNNTGGNNANNTLEVRASSISRLGPYPTQPILKNISTATTTVLKVGPGILRHIILNNSGANGAKAAVYDNTAVNDGGNGLAVWGTLNTGIGAGAGAQAYTQWEYEAPFFTGLTIQTFGGNTPSDISVVYE